MCALPPAPTNSLAIHGRTIIVTLISFFKIYFGLLPSRRASALFCRVKLCVRDAPLGNNVAKYTPGAQLHSHWCNKYFYSGAKITLYLFISGTYYFVPVVLLTAVSFYDEVFYFYFQ